MGSPRLGQVRGGQGVGGWPQALLGSPGSWVKGSERNQVKPLSQKPSVMVGLGSQAVASLWSPGPRFPLL